jgi:hypothetical protein
MKQFKILFDDKPEGLLPIYKAYPLANQDLTEFDAILSAKAVSYKIPVFADVKAMNRHFFKPLKAAIQGKPKSAGVAYIVLNFFDIGDQITNLMVRDIAFEVEPNLDYPAITNAMARLQRSDAVVNEKFVGVKPMILENLYLKNKFPRFPETRTPLIVKGLPAPILKRAVPAASFTPTPPFADNSSDEVLQAIGRLQANMEKALEATLLKHDDRVDVVLAQFLPNKDKIAIFLDLIKGLSPENEIEYMDLMKNIRKAYK